MSLGENLFTVARIFDPLGLIAPCFITLKTLLQQLWRSGIRWDQEVPHEYNAIIKKWIRQCGQENNVKLPKFIGHIDIHSDILLLDFTDASQCAIAAFIYIRISKQAHKQSSFTIGRTKSAPLNQEAYAARIPSCSDW